MGRSPPKGRQLAAEAFLLFSMAFGPLAFGTVEGWSQNVLLAAIFAMLLLCRPILIPSHPVRRFLLPAATATLAIAVAQWLSPRDPAHPAGWAPFTASRGDTERSLLLWAAYAAVVACVPSIASRPAAQKRLAWTVLLVGASVSVLGLAQRAEGNVLFYGLRPIRYGDPFGPYQNPNHAASLMAMSALTGCGLALSRLSAFLGDDSGESRWDALASLALVVLLVGVVVCGLINARSLGAALSASLGALALVPAAGRMLHRAHRLKTGVASLLLAAAIAVAANRSLTPSLSVSYRTSMYGSAAAMIGDFPAFGIGLGAFEKVFPVYQEPLVGGRVRHAHNDWLETAAQIGLAGAGSLLIGGALYLWHVGAAWRRLAATGRGWLMAGSLASCLAFLFHGLVDFSFQIPANALVFLSLLALIGAQAHEAARSSARPAAEL